MRRASKRFQSTGLIGSGRLVAKHTLQTELPISLRTPCHSSAMLFHWLVLFSVFATCIWSDCLSLMWLCHAIAEFSRALLCHQPCCLFQAYSAWACGWFSTTACHATYFSLRHSLVVFCWSLPSSASFLTSPGNCFSLQQSVDSLKWFPKWSPCHLNISWKCLPWPSCLSIFISLVSPCLWAVSHPSAASRNIPRCILQHLSIFHSISSHPSVSLRITLHSLVSLSLPEQLLVFPCIPQHISVSLSMSQQISEICEHSVSPSCKHISASLSIGQYPTASIVISLHLSTSLLSCSIWQLSSISLASLCIPSHLSAKSL